MILYLVYTEFGLLHVATEMTAVRTLMHACQQALAHHRTDAEMDALNLQGIT